MLSWTNNWMLPEKKNVHLYCAFSRFLRHQALMKSLSLLSTCSAQSSATQMYFWSCRGISCEPRVLCSQCSVTFSCKSSSLCSLFKHVYTWTHSRARGQVKSRVACLHKAVKLMLKCLEFDGQSSDAMIGIFFGFGIFRFMNLQRMVEVQKSALFDPSDNLCCLYAVSSWMLAT